MKELACRVENNFSWQLERKERVPRAEATWLAWHDKVRHLMWIIMRSYCIFPIHKCQYISVLLSTKICARVHEACSSKATCSMLNWKHIVNNCGSVCASSSYSFSTCACADQHALSMTLPHTAGEYQLSEIQLRFRFEQTRSMRDDEMLSTVHQVRRRHGGAKALARCGNLNMLVR